eukprot:CAMPEP_0206238090 /NCGR_PEP_ID=MMETSP0047_2-20121206/14625_1 /ASSEMBLY_ACC=CAM_ASM_000192 /TAXON_ID=195065 /ORGANISM="Chroomonas mesostigmatica_cf, Strain CCMP1168" /LENGTH=680 /DNA_ID=CAMNT_0053662593 /DNA_START=10 /DNA_END=2052 /DNA_ORIENTATION=-
MVGVAFVGVQYKNQSKRRKELADRKKVHRKFIHETLKKWDKSGTGALSFEEMRNWLTDIAKGERATDDEVRWVQSMANMKQVKMGSFKPGQGVPTTEAENIKNASVLPEDFTTAVQAWMSYREALDEINAMFAKFDKDHSEYLDAPQLAELLTALNDGEPAVDSEVEWVLASADILGNGVITRPELTKAIALWYTRHPDEKQPPITPPHTKAAKISGINIIPVQRNNQSARRKELAKRKADHKKFVQGVLNKWDASGTGALSFQELKKWLSDISAGEEATDDEVRWVQVMCNKNNLNMSVMPEDFTSAIDVWLSYKESKAEIEKIFAKHDTDGTDSLDKEQLGNLLTELNDGVRPPDDEIEWVLGEADKIGNNAITKPELQLALGIWYSRHDAEELGGGGAITTSAKKLASTSSKNVAPATRSAKNVAPAASKEAAKEHMTQAQSHKSLTEKMHLVIVPRNNQSARRKELAKKKDDHKRFIKETLAKWDKSGTGALSFEELRDWLSDISPGAKATDDEVSWIAALANMDKGAFKNDKSAASKASVLPGDFTKAVEAWMSYRESKQEIDEMFAKYDTDKSNTLDKAQLTEVLTALNAGTKPDDTEVNWVMENADVIGNGVITKPELGKAISIWYSHVNVGESQKGVLSPQGTPAPASAAHPKGQVEAVPSQGGACGKCSIQ